MIITVTNEAPFQVLTGAFTIGPSPTGYELQVGATPQSFTTLFSVGANTPRMVTNVANGSYYRLKNNVGDVKVNWSRTCIDNQGGGSGSGTTYTAGEYISIEQDVISVTGITPDQYLTSADTQDLASQAYVDAAITAGTQDLASQGYVNSAITAATQNMATEQDIQTAIASETARTESTYAKPADIPSLAGYATEAYVTGITDTIEDHLDDVERVTATAYTELHQDIVALSGATSGYATHAEVTAATANMATQAYVTAATQGMATQTWVGQQGYITSAYTGFTSTQDFEDFAGQMEEKEEVVASSLVELDGRFSSYVQGGGDITAMQKISQADYNDLVSGGTIDESTFYIITGSTGN